MTRGFHTTYIHCLTCSRCVGMVLPDNALVGQVKRLRCLVCGARNAQISMSFRWGEPPPYDRVPGAPSVSGL